MYKNELITKRTITIQNIDTNAGHFRTQFGIQFMELQFGFRIQSVLSRVSNSNHEPEFQAQSVEPDQRGFNRLITITATL